LNLAKLPALKFEELPMWERGFLGGIRAKLLQSCVIIGRRALHDVIVGCPMWKVPVGQLRLLPGPTNENVVSML